MLRSTPTSRRRWPRPADDLSISPCACATRTKRVSRTPKLSPSASRQYLSRGLTVSSFDTKLSPPRHFTRLSPSPEHWASATSRSRGHLMPDRQSLSSRAMKTRSRAVRAAQQQRGQGRPATQQHVRMPALSGCGDTPTLRPPTAGAMPSSFGLPKHHGSMTTNCVRGVQAVPSSVVETEGVGGRLPPGLLHYMSGTRPTTCSAVMLQTSLIGLQSPRARGCFRAQAVTGF